MDFLKNVLNVEPKEFPTLLKEPQGKSRSPCQPTFSAPAPSPSYKFAEELERQEANSKLPKTIPQDLKNTMQQWKETLLADQAEKTRKAGMTKDGPEPAKDPYELTVTEDGSGHKRPEIGDTVRVGYVVTVDTPDAPIVDAKPDFDYTIGEASQGSGELQAKVLEGALPKMKRGERASMTCTLGHLFARDAIPIKEHGEDAVAVCEVKLTEIFQTKDCSFEKGSRKVVKEVLQTGIGAWCDNPTDEGSATLRIEEVRASDGSVIFPESGGKPLEIDIVPGNGQVCDALECALLEMRRHETSLITCKEPALCKGGEPLGIGSHCTDEQLAGATFKVTLTDYGKGPDAMMFEEEDRLVFALRRKVEANRLFSESRFYLARERYRKIIELFHHMDKKKFKDRFLGRSDTLEQCKDLRKQCRLNAAMCSLRLQDSVSAKDFCDLVLWEEPENTKALYRRAKSFFQAADYVQACKDLSRLMDIDPSIAEARQLFDQAKRLRAVSDRKQKAAFKFGRSVDGLNDPRSIKNDYMDTPMDLPGVEGESVSKQWAPKKKQEQ